MRRPRPAYFRLAPLFGAVLLCLSACEDPSGVGLTIIDPGESDPRAQVLIASGVASVPLDDRTGAFLTNPSFASFRVLAGHVADPLFGTTTAQAYIDVLAPTSFPDGFQDRPVREARLRLVRSYVYGDTTSATTLDIRQIEEEWTATSATADTTFPVLDPVITSFEVSASDSLIVIDLPESWVSANDATLRSDDFSTEFHGFHLSTDATSGAVYGFRSNASLELISEEDTVRYNGSELFSGLVHEPATSFPDGLVPVQDGSSTGLEVTFDFESVGAEALNTAFLRVTADTVASQSGSGAGFVRPLARELALFGTFENLAPLLIATATLDEETQTYSFQSSTITGLLQSLIIGQEPVDGFALGVPTARTSIDPIALVAPPAEDGPRAVLVLVPTQD